MKLEDQQTIDSMLTRLRRIEGQVRGVQAMLQQGRDCREVLQQLTAVRSAVQSASLFYFEEAASNCILNLEESNAPQRQELLQDMITILGKL